MDKFIHWMFFFFSWKYPAITGSRIDGCSSDLSPMDFFLRASWRTAIITKKRQTCRARILKTTITVWQNVAYVNCSTFSLALAKLKFDQWLCAKFWHSLAVVLSKHPGPGLHKSSEQIEKKVGFFPNKDMQIRIY